MKFTYEQIMGFIRKYNKTSHKFISADTITAIHSIANTTKYALIKMEDIVNNTINTMEGNK